MKKVISFLLITLMTLYLFGCRNEDKFNEEILIKSEFVQTELTDDFSYDIYEDYVEIVEYKGSEKEIKLPEKFQDKKIKSIGDYAFKNCNNLVSVKFSSSIIRIGQYAFSECNNLGKVIFNNELIKISNNAFYKCPKLNNITIPSGVKYIGHLAFYDCENLEKISVPDTVSDIGAGAFKFTKWLENKNEEFVFAGDNVLVAYKGDKTEVTVPENTKQISAFYDCYDITNINFNKGLESIGEMAFANCGQIREIILPDGLIKINNSAFAWCGNLEKIVLPSTLKQISDTAFSDCSSIGKITIPKNVKIIGDRIFQRCENLKEIIFENPKLEIKYKLFGNENKSVVIISEDNSAISQYCKDNNYNFKNV
ncbi:MAG: leucine-rich repeat domain-containing protein [Clostridia bacterium]|nr:leucine-rich repeat domain-containing protein [Clostridia bacterium]